MTKAIIEIVNELNQAAYDAQGHLGLQIQPFTYMTDGNDDYILFFDHPIWDTVDCSTEESELRRVVAEEAEIYFESLRALLSQDTFLILEVERNAQP